MQRTATERPQPVTIDRGDVVTLKTDDRRYTVLGPVWGMPATYLVRHLAPPAVHEVTVRRCEIASVEKQGDTRPPEAGDQLAEAGSIDWEPSDAHDDRNSACGRFSVMQIGGTYAAFDWDDRDSAGPFPLVADAIAWCEDRAATKSDPTPWEADAMPAVLSGGTLSWSHRDSGEFASACGRFKITPKCSAMSGLPLPGVYFATDERLRGCCPNSGRWWEDGSLSECRQWCEDRAAEPVAEKTSGVRVTEDDGGQF